MFDLDRKKGNTKKEADLVGGLASRALSLTGSVHAWNLLETNSTGSVHAWDLLETNSSILYM